MFILKHSADTLRSCCCREIYLISRTSSELSLLITIMTVIYRNLDRFLFQQHMMRIQSPKSSVVSVRRGAERLVELVGRIL